MVTNIYLVRHGEVHNPKGILYGRLPRFKLSEKGKKQIEDTAEFLKDKSVTAIYSSPMLRTRQSALIIQNKLNLPKINIERDLLEVKTSLQGQLFADLDLTTRDYYSPPLWREGDDTMLEIATRMEKTIRNMIDRHKHSSVVAVSHGDPIMILKAHLHNLPMKISSLRLSHYITHGEVMNVQQINDGPVTIKSVFIPHA